MRLFFICLILVVASANIQGEAIYNLCTGLIHTLEELLLGKGSLAVKNYIETLCAKTSGLLETLCNKILDFGVDKLVEMIESKADPTTICTSLGAC